MTIVLEASLPQPLFRRGKVRDNYELGENLLIVATDRISAFDYVLPCGIPNKGKVLNQLSAFWFDRTSHIIPNHVIRTINSPADVQACMPAGWNGYASSLVGRSMVVKRAQVVPVECVVRGYLAGSAWSEYKKSGTMNSMPMPAGLVESQELPEPVFTPSTKAEVGHDEPITVKQVADLVGGQLAKELEEKSLAIYTYARNLARDRGIIIADTKFEFGICDGNLILIDEVLTPDSSRFWDAETYKPGNSQPSFDKQMVRDWLIESGWNKEPPVPVLPDDLIARTAERYQDVYRRLTGQALQA